MCSTFADIDAPAEKESKELDARDLGFNKAAASLMRCMRIRIFSLRYAFSAETFVCAECLMEFSQF